MPLEVQNILVAPLNWGLGHATRCVPIIKALLAQGFSPILASDGVALEMLRKEFPDLPTLELPSYQIEYAKNGANFKWKMLQQTPQMVEAVLREKKTVKKWVRDYKLVGIISDNRLGVYHKKVPSVFITHQLNVLSGNTSWLSSSIHRLIIKKFTECWVPDAEDKPNLSGKLGHLKSGDNKIRYLGPLSRLQKMELPVVYDLMVILSGPEPQRGMLENQLREELLTYKGKILFICGRVEAKQKKDDLGHITHYNFMTASQLERAFNESKTILCRSGYTTLMDLAHLGKKAFLIPTPGQYEQEYLAKRLKKEGYLPYAKQEKFKKEQLLEIDLYKGLPMVEKPVHWKQLFGLFEGEREF